MSALGSLIVKLALEHAEFTKGLDKSSQEALRFAKGSQDAFDKFERSTTAAFGKVAKSTLGAVSAFASASFVINQLTKAFAFADSQILDVATTNEVAVSSVLKLSQALMLSGGSATDSSKVFSALTNSIDSAAKGSEETQKRFASLGVTLTDLRTLDGQQLFEKTLAGLRDIEDPIQRNAAAMDLLGKAIKGVDVVGLADNYANNQGNFEDAEESFKAIGEAMDRLDSFTFKTSQTLAETFGPALLAVVTTVDNLVFGFDKLEKSISKAGNANAKFKSAPKIGDAPTAGAFNLPTEFQAQAPEVREVLDREAKRAEDEAKRKAEKAMDEAKRRAEKARDDAIKMALEESAFKAKLESDYQTKLKSDFDKRMSDQEKAEKERIQKVMEWQQQLANKNFEEAQEQANRAADEFKRNQEQTAREVSQAFTNGLFDSFRNGESFGKAMVRNIVALGQTWFAKMFEGLLTGGGSFLSSLFSGSSSAGSLVPTSGSGGGGGVGQLFGGLKDIFQSGNASIVSSIENLGVFLSNGSGGLGDTLGGLIGQYSGQIANVLPYAGAFMKLVQGDLEGAAFTAAGTAIGSIFGPIGAGIGSVIGSFVGGLFGGGLPPRVTESRSATTSGGITSFYNGADPGKRKLGAANQLDALNQTFANNLNTLFGSFDVNADITSNSLLTKKKNTRSRFWASLNGEFLGFDEAGFGKKGTMEEAFASLVERALGSYTAKAIQASDLPAGVKSIFEGLANKEEIADAINTIVQFRSTVGDLPPIFEKLNEALDTNAYTTTLAEFKSRAANLQTYTNLFYTAQENFDTFTRQLNTQFDALNQTLPATRDGFRELVDGFKVVDETTSDQFHGLVALSSATDAYYKQLEQQKEIVEQTTGALRDLNSFTSLAEYRQYKGVAASYGSTFALDNTANFRTGALGNNAAGQGVVTSTGLSNVERLLQELRDYFKQNAKSAADQVDLLDTFNRIGIPTRA